MAATLAEVAREAYAAGVAISGGPVTGRVRCGCEAAVSLALENRDDPRVLEVSLHLGHLEGTWAEVYRRREDLTAKLARKILGKWRPLARQLDPAHLMAMYRRALATREADAGGKPSDADKAAARASAITWLEDILTSPGYRDLATEISGAIIASMAEGKTAALAIAADQASRLGFDWAKAHAAMYAGLADLENLPELDAPWAQAIIRAAASDAGRLLAVMAASGASDEDIADALWGASADDAVMLAIDTAISGSMARGALDLYAAEGLTLVAWLTAGDGRVCFPAGTPVMTPDGQRPIEALRSGDPVITPQGELPVHCTGSRLYSGGLTVLHAERGTVAATDDHPFWTPSGWREAGEIQPGDLVHARDDERAEVRSVVHFIFAQPDDVPADTGKLCVTPRVAGGGAAVPVFTVSFDADLARDDGEVEGPAADGVFLLELGPEGFKGDPDAGLQPGLAAEAAVAGQGAELLMGQARGLPEFGLAIPAGQEHGRPTALLRAEMPVKVLLGPEAISAPLAVDVNSVSVLAGERADLVAGGNRRLDGEVLPADRAVLGDDLPATGVIAGSATESPVVLLPAATYVEALAAPGAGSVRQQRGGVVAAGGAELPISRDLPRAGELLTAVGAFIAERHDGTRSDVYVTGIGGIPVYDIEVEKAHVFYASGFLVHNCSSCQDNEDQGPYDPMAFPACPDHPRCRCTPTPASPLPVSAFAAFLLSD